MIDLLQPISSFNRTERVLVEYDGFINSLTERFVMLLELQRDKYIHHNKFKEILELSNDDIFNISNLYTVEEFNKIFLNNELSKDYIDKLFDMNLIEFQREPAFNYSLYNLIQESFVESVSIIKKTEFLDYELESIGATFGDYFNKVHLYTGETESLVKDYKFTTVCTSSFKTLQNIIEEKKDKRMYFILQNKHDNINMDTMGYKYMDEVTKYMEEGYFISRMYSMCIEENENEVLNPESISG